jgi:hypothetical protein
MSSNFVYLRLSSTALVTKHWRQELQSVVSVTSELTTADRHRHGYTNTVGRAIFSGFCKEN